jgi:hypothetical protein
MNKHFVLFVLTAAIVISITTLFETEPHDEVQKTVSQSEERMKRYKAMMQEYNAMAGSAKLRALSCNPSQSNVKSTFEFEHALFVIQETLGSSLSENFARATSTELHHRSRIVMFNVMDEMAEMDLATHEMVLFEHASTAFQSLSMLVGRLLE